MSQIQNRPGNNIFRKRKRKTPPLKISRQFSQWQIRFHCMCTTATQKPFSIIREAILIAQKFQSGDAIHRPFFSARKETILIAEMTQKKKNCNYKENL